MDTHEQLRGLFARISGPELYRNNPFRRLGLSVLASPREVTKRCDQLRLSSELGLSDKTRAFAPARPPTVDEVRECAQQLQDPTLRLVFEFFWFWPVSYPDAGEDAGLAALEKGDAEEAFGIWCKALSKGNTAGLHNMAVYFHLIALDWELDDLGSERSDDEIWGPALKYWNRVVACDGIWEALSRRTQAQVAASMHGGFAAELRRQLPSAVAGINAQWALIHAEKGLFARAAQHSDIVLGLHGDPAEGRRMLEACAASSVRRIDARVADCRRLAESGAESLLPAVISLLVDCDPEVRIIEGFCGAGSPRSREFCHGLFAGALDALVAYQRKTHDNRGCLPLLIHLLDKPVTPELHQRVVEAFEVVYTNAVASERLREGEPRTDAACRLLSGCLLPSERILNFNTASRPPYRARVGGLLARLAESCSSNPLAPNLGARALSAAAALYTGHPEGALLIEAPACTLQVSSEGITLNGHRVPLAEVVGLRYGLSTAQGAGTLVPVVAWSSFTEAWELDLAAFGARPDDTLPLYTAIIFALDHFVRPALAQTMLGWLRSGEEVVIGDLRLRRDGLRLAAGDDAEKIPFAQLMAGQDSTSLHLSGRAPRGFSITLDCSSVWNAAIIAQVIDTLAGDVETSADDRARISSPGLSA